MVGIDLVAGGATSGNGWGRPISMSGGMDYWVGSWPTLAPDRRRTATTGSAWNRTAPPTTLPTPLPLAGGERPIRSRLTVPLSVLGLVDGQTFKFDAYSAGGGGTDKRQRRLEQPQPLHHGLAGALRQRDLRVDLPSRGAGADIAGAPLHYRDGIAAPATRPVTFMPLISFGAKPLRLMGLA